MRHVGTGSAAPKDAQKILDDLSESATGQSAAEALSSAQGTHLPPPISHTGLN